MNRAMRRSEELRQILLVRQTSKRLAQQQAQQASHALGAAERNCEAEAGVLNEVIGQWHCARNAPLFDPLALAAWGNAVNQQAAKLSDREADVVRCDAEFVTAQKRHGRAVAEERCAQSLLRKARLRIARSREENRLAERDDINTRRTSLR